MGSRRRMHRKRGIDRGTEVIKGSRVWGGYPCGVWGAPSSGKVTKCHLNTVFHFLQSKNSYYIENRILV